MDGDGLKAAFELIQEEIGSASKELKDDAKRLVDASDFDQVKHLMETGKRLDQFQLDVKALEQKWVSAFDPATRSRTTYEPEPLASPSTAEISLVMEYPSAQASANMKGKEVILLPGSKIRKQTFGSMQEDVLKRKNRAIEKGELKDSGNPLLFELEVPIGFSSPSAAAAFVAGCSVNGQKEWQVANQGISLKSWHAQH